jgi:glycosyltransferase involved in cell wall biosynthesis
MMKVLALRADSGGCAKYRVWEPARVVHEKYSDIEIKIKSGLSVDATQDVKTGLYTVNEITEDVDLIIFQRPLGNYGLSSIYQARRQGIATIVELDDDFENVDKDNVAWSKIQPEFDSSANYMWLSAAMKESDLVTVSTPALARFESKYGGVRIIRNYIPEGIFKITKTQGITPRIGWTGTTDTHPHDLEVTGGAIANVMKKTGADICIVGDGRRVRGQLGMSDAQTMYVTGVQPLKTYYQSIANNIDVGIVPLDMTPFNEAKSYLKMMEFSALGIPVVFTPTSENLLLHEEGIGIPAETPAEWKKAVTSLVENERKRNQMGKKARDIIREKYTYEQHAHEWYDAWTWAIDNRTSLEASISHASA